MTIAKKILCIYLAALMLISACPLTAFADEEWEFITSEDGLWTYDVDYVKAGVSYGTLWNYNGSESSVVVPSEVDGCVIKAMTNTFWEKYDVKTVVISEGIESVGNCFVGLSDLSVTLPQSLKIIGYRAFYHSTIKKLNFNSNLEAIDGQAFLGCTFLENEIRLPDTLQCLPRLTFSECDFTNVSSIFIPASARYLNPTREKSGDISYDYIEEDWTDSPFYKCRNLARVTVDEDNADYYSYDNMLCSKDMKNLFCIFRGSYNELKLPSVSNIVDYAFYSGCTADKVVIPRSVEFIDAQAFNNGNLYGVEFEPNSSLKILYSSFGTKISGDLVIPSSVEEISDRAFKGCNITSLSFEPNSSCKRIGKEAFSGCSSLKSAVIPKSVTVIGIENPYTNNLDEKIDSYTFSSCKSLESITIEADSELEILGKGFVSDSYALKEFNIGEGSSLLEINCDFSNTKVEHFDFSTCPNLSYITGYAFQKCNNLKSVDLSGTVVDSISNKAFYDCPNLEKVILPDTVSSISNDAFGNCERLTDVTADYAINIHSSAFEGTPLKDEFSPKEEQIFNDFKYYECKNGIVITGYVGDEIDIIIPSHINSKPVTQIGEKAFYNLDLQMVEIPQTVEIIGSHAFADNRFTELPTLPRELKIIKDYAFNKQDYSLDYEGALVLPSTTVRIEECAFCSWNFETITFNEGLNYLGSYCFISSRTEEITIPDSLRFYSSNAISIRFPKKIKLGANSAVADKIFEEFNASESYRGNVQTVDVSVNNDEYISVDGVVFTKDMKTVVFYPPARTDESFVVPSGVTKIGKRAFQNSLNLKSIDFNDVELIDDFAFFASKGLETVAFSNKIKAIGDEAFSGAAALKSVEFQTGFKTQKLSYTFENTPSLETVTFADDVEIEHLFGTFVESGITSIKLPSKIEKLECTFASSNLEKVVLPSELKILGRSAFANTNLTSVEIPDNVISIVYYCFSECKKLDNIDFNNVKNIGYRAFEGCKALCSVDLTGVTYVHAEAFADCVNLKKFYFIAEEKQSYISAYEFEGNQTLETVVIGSGITEIEDGAFAGCSNLETALIADEVEEISDTAFENCENLTIVCENNSPAMLYAVRNNISYQTFTVAPIPNQNYTGKAITPSLSVKQGQTLLSKDSDYTATYRNNVNIGVASVAVVGLGDYRIFATTANFNIVHNHSYQGKVTKAATCGSNGIKTYTCICGDKYTETIKATGKHNYKGKVTKAATCGSNGIKTYTCTCGAKYTETIKATGKHNYKGKVTKAATCSSNGIRTYTCTCGKKYTETIKATGKHSYTSKVTKAPTAAKAGVMTYTCKTCGKKYTKSISKLVKTSISKITSKSKGFTVSWKKVSSATGYQVQYASNRKFTGAKNITISKNSTTAKTVSKLKAEKNYYVRIRTYRIINGKKYYSAWSGYKSVTTKK